MTPRATELRRRLAKRRKAWLPPDLEGEVFGDRYRLGELIGIGGMALVYKAEHIEIHKPVAVKILHPRYADRPEYARRFLAEARAASKLSHDHIIDISDFGRASDGYVYYVLEYLEGEDLEQTLKEDGPLPWFRVVPIAKQICKALTAAHEAGIIHRDIKPGNCFRITRDENNDFIKILDFGIATSALKSQAGDRDEPLGTPAYMAPELFLGVPFDHRVDLYSLGVLMYKLLTGRLPSEGDERARSSASMVRAMPEIELPGPIEDLIVHAMAEDPGERVQTAREFYLALERIQESLTRTSRLSRDPLAWRGEPEGAWGRADVSVSSDAARFTEVTVRVAHGDHARDSSPLLTLERQTPSRHLLPPAVSVAVALIVVVLAVIIGRDRLNREVGADPAPRDMQPVEAAPPPKATRAATPIDAPVAAPAPEPAPRESSRRRAHAGHREPAQPAPEPAPSAAPESEPALEPAAVGPSEGADALERRRRDPTKKPARGLLPKGAFDRVIEGAIPAIRGCQTRFSGGFPAPVDAVIRVSPVGHVIKVELKDMSRVGICARDAISKLTFPASPRGGTFSHHFDG